MTLRDALHGSEDVIRARLEEVLDSEDAVVLLANRRGVTTFAHGFGASGCQLESIGRALEAQLRELTAMSSHRTEARTQRRGAPAQGRKRLRAAGTPPRR